MNTLKWSTTIRKSAVRAKVAAFTFFHYTTALRACLIVFDFNHFTVYLVFLFEYLFSSIFDLNHGVGVVLMLVCLGCFCLIIFNRWFFLSDIIIPPHIRVDLFKQRPVSALCAFAADTIFVFIKPDVEFRALAYATLAINIDKFFLPV